MTEPFKVPASPIAIAGKAQQDPQQPLKHALKFNLQMNPIHASKSNGYKGKKILKRDFSSASMPRDYSDAFLPKKIEVEKNFLRINYLKDKEQEAAEAVAHAFTVINQSSKSSVKLSPRRPLTNAASEKNFVNKHFKQQQQQQQQQVQKQHNHHSHQKQQIDQNEHSQGEKPKRKSSILQGQMQLAAEMTSFPRKKSQDQLKILQIQTGNHELNSNQHQNEQFQQKSQDGIDPSSSSSPVEQTDKILNQPSQQPKQQTEQKKSSKTPEKRPSGSSGNSRRTPNNNDNQSMKSLRIYKDNSINFSNKSLNSPISSVRYQAVNGCVSDLSVEWNNKGSILSASGCNKTAEMLQKKFQTIFQRKQEKAQIRQLQSAEKALRDELYGLFSQQSRQLKIKKQQEIQLLENLQKNVFSIPDTLQIQRVNELVRSSYEAFKVKKVQEAEEAIKAEEEDKKRRADILLKYGTAVRQSNSERQHELDAEKESKGENYLNNIPHPWGIDQRKFETKSADKKPEKMIRKQKIPLKELFTLNVTANEAVKEKLIAVQEQQNSQRVIRESKMIQRKPMTAEERTQIAQVRCQKVIEEIEKAEKEETQKKEEIKGKLKNLEQNRLKSIEKTKKIPFKPTEEMITNAFMIIQKEDENVENGVENTNHMNGMFDQTFGLPKQNKQIVGSEQQQQQQQSHDRAVEEHKGQKKEESRESSGKIHNINRENHRKQDMNQKQGKGQQLSQKKREESNGKSSNSIVAKRNKQILP